MLGHILCLKCLQSSECPTQPHSPLASSLGAFTKFSSPPSQNPVPAVQQAYAGPPTSPNRCRHPISSHSLEASESHSTPMFSHRCSHKSIKNPLNLSSKCLKLAANHGWPHDAGFQSELETSSDISVHAADTALLTSRSSHP